MMAAAPPQDLTGPKDASARKGEPSAPAQATTRHDEFYFTDEMTVFQVENRLFRVHRHFLAENSLAFSSMFSLPRAPTDGSAVEGTSDSNPIHLSGVTELEFETLLRYFYQRCVPSVTAPLGTANALPRPPHFLNVRERAIREIYGQVAQPQDHLLLLSVAEKYDLPPKHLLSSLVVLVTRPQPLTEGEVARFSALTVSRLAHAREDFVRRTVNPPPLQPGWLATVPNGPSWKDDVAKDVVCKIWEIQNDGHDSDLLVCRITTNDSQGIFVLSRFSFRSSHHVLTDRPCPCV
ncbi:hypothetical protein B0F90DRAFT_1701254 [Multifurca ochricompacta]|uniref:BTB domain-containing protein n=1 Tax=Multifurca ochricompacta TaxID=376703 RepID=A0AAD4QQD4_9AGAM|nr:hypothetical protein B0F90DRAFT_1701254 [Multifurca ochricompacta]